MSAPVLMVQGTASSVGKSVIAAGLCRILRRRGLHVAPFKAQNMSLNAAVTRDGAEIARSTAVQAAAAGLEPTVDMNPILIKPEADSRSQVIIRGNVWGTLQVGDYFHGGLDLWPVVADALDRLRAMYDVIIAEGAGSPAEMNLRERDLANMRVAKHARAAVVLVGDIDRGGVFAQLIGTLDLLPPDERALVQGLIVNRFRGDPTLFAEGVQFLEQRTALSVLGIIPWVTDLGLADEDSTSLDDRRDQIVTHPSPAELLRIAIIRLPGIANFDDFAPLERDKSVRVSYVDRPELLVNADLLILPGSKSTMADLRFLHERGLSEVIQALYGRGTPIIGICGGYQMLGQEIRDPGHVESSSGPMVGLGLLPHITTFHREKRTARVRGRLVGAIGPFAEAAGAEIVGYEIHAGRTDLTDGSAPAAPLRVIERSERPVDEPDGAVSNDGLVFGTYLHGFFENKLVCQSLLAWLRARRGQSSPMTSSAERVSVVEFDPFERWADILEASLNLPRLLAHCGVPSND